jgi:endonuclease/exonuclease/phosphatase family metal-dependent hydrolase
MRKILLALLLTAASVVPVQAAQQPLTVMSRNLYLGADVGVAMELIPDFSAAAQFMWSQVSATDFSKRAPVLAREVIAQNADVVGLQEATHWYCKKNLWSKKVIVFDFTEQFLKATRRLGHEYVLASKAGVNALNIGYSIPAIPFLTMVSDPDTFQPLFGSNRAACGFEIGDALVLKKEIASKIIQVGNSEYETSYSVIPKIMTIYRGYTWADINYNGTSVRIVSTHLESLWDSNKVPNSVLQAKQLIKDLSSTKMPTIVIGDFNSDPRDPRQNSESNPGGQPEASNACRAQVEKPSLNTAIDSCNAYWLMRKAGFTDVGPDAQNGENFTWGMNALLTGPDKVRYQAALKMGNKYGFTDRLDYILLKNGAKVVSSKIIGNTPPKSGLWPSDHASVVAEVALPAYSEVSTPLDSHKPFPISFWNWIGIALVIALGSLITWRRIRNHG